MAHRHGGLIAVAAAVAAGLALAGCADGGDVATMSGTAGASQGTSPEEEQATGAEKLSDCLDAATSERMSKLYDVLWEASNEYWAHYQEQQMEEVPATSAG
ncbi:MAG: hypothetical protein LBG60_15125 [Bifidobacteriaceae bacterium]|jgi:hypothetical protein|nr:hypothetical protein [Bifidobacteriaceae bacterium]